MKSRYTTLLMPFPKGIVREAAKKHPEGGGCRDHGTSNINEFNIHHASPSYFHHPGGAETW